VELTIQPTSIKNPVIINAPKPIVVNVYFPNPICKVRTNIQNLPKRQFL
jgi:hypothetical protein